VDIRGGGIKGLGGKTWTRTERKKAFFGDPKTRRKCKGGNCVLRLEKGE